MYLNHDLVMTLTCFRERSTWVAYAFEWLKLFFKKKMPFEGKNLQVMAGENNGLRASSAPLLGLFSIISKHVYWYIQQISGECLQDH